ncbi:carbohydrate kinase family protein [Neobittarella massiliensis]|uniref:carbohydrate kinase family protein n=1 Tax=Neobittarella massiliensis (ex Bilen et al. 2018) TaxID=2041842 RepID=UPI000CF6D1C7|nr:PfkB family carbohydrate kinase [Neobittarella massiliensis]
MAEIQGGNTHVAGRRPFVACCGTTGIDIAILSRQEIKLWEKNNDILVKMSCGGMMRNIAENLARLGVSAVLFSNVGDDLYGQKILQDSADAGIDMSRVRIEEGCTSNTFISVDQPDGEMLVGLGDALCSDRLGAAYFEENMLLLQQASLLVLCPALPAECLDFIARKLPHIPKLLDMNSAGLVENVRRRMAMVDILKVNKYEAQELTGIALRQQPDLDMAAEAVFAMGVKQLYITLGDRGAYYRDTRGTRLFAAARPDLPVINTTGSGDSFTAGIAYGHMAGYAPPQSMKFAMACAEITLQSADTVNSEITLQRVLAAVESRREQAL